MYRKASASASSNCIEVDTAYEDHILIRESEDPEVIVITTRENWEVFLKAVKAGEFG